MDFGQTRYHKVIGELNSAELLDGKQDGIMDELPETIILAHDWNDTYSHIKIGALIALIVVISSFFIDFKTNSKYILLVFGIISVFFMSMSWLRKPLQFNIELDSNTIKVKTFTFRWLDVDKMYKIKTNSGRNPKFGIKLVLNDQREINIDLSLRKPENNNSMDCFQFIYMFWQREITGIKEQG